MLLPKLSRPANDLIHTVVWFFWCLRVFISLGWVILFLAPFPMCCFSIEMSDVLVGIRQWDIQANAERLFGASTPTYLGDLNGHSWRGRRRRRRGRGRSKSFVPFSVFSIPSQFFLCIFLTREGRWFRPALKPLAGAHAWINGWRGQKSLSGLLEFSFGVSAHHKV